MADSLRDQLLKSGLMQQLKAEKISVAPVKKSLKLTSESTISQPAVKNSDVVKRQTAVELDLAKAYHLRARQEKLEREAHEREAAERAREKKERKEKFTQLLRDKALNEANADLPRHFSHGNKIRRIYCTSTQLTQLNKGELGIVQMAGRYLLVTRSVALEAQQINPAALILLVDPDSTTDEDDIPADIIW